MTTIKNIRARNAETLAKVRAANAPGADSAYYQAEMDQLKATKTATAEAVESQASKTSRFERLYADYMQAGDNILAEVNDIGWVRTIGAVLLSVCAAAGTYALGLIATDMLLVATCGAASTGFIPLVIAIIGMVLTGIASMLVLRVTANAVLGEYDDVVIAKVKAAKKFVTSIFDRRVIVLGGA